MTVKEFAAFLVNNCNPNAVLMAHDHHGVLREVTKDDIDEMRAYQLREDDRGQGVGAHLDVWKVLQTGEQTEKPTVVALIIDP